jgi:hypothetical protein
MTIYLVAVTQRQHVCLAEAESHPVDTTRTVLQTIQGRTCLNPVTISCGGLTATIPCGRHNPADHQCGNCRAVITHPMGGSL